MTVAQTVNISQLSLSASLTANTSPIQNSLLWHIYPNKLSVTNNLSPLATSKTAQPVFELPYGTYLVHVAYGNAGANQLINVNQKTQSIKINLQAGGLQLFSSIDGKRDLNAKDVGYDIYYKETENIDNPELIAKNVQPGNITRLTEGVYEIISRYGTASNIRKTEIKVVAGKLMKIRLIHKAARISLKLVSRPNGEALPETVWSILTPGGDVVIESNNNAFPQFILSEGEYSVIAKHNNEVYNRNFSVEPGGDKIVELLTDAEK